MPVLELTRDEDGRVLYRPYQQVVCDRCEEAGAYGSTEPQAVGWALRWGWGVRYGTGPGGNARVYCPTCLAALDAERRSWAGSEHYLGSGGANGSAGRVCAAVHLDNGTAAADGR